MLEEKRKELVQRIERAFSDIAYPGDDNIVPNPSVRLDDIIDTVTAFTGKHWKTVPLDLLILNRDSLPFFTPEAYRFFLPAYLKATVLHFESVDALKHYTVSNLTPHETRMEYFLSRAKGFTREQGEVIRDFLKLYSELDPDFAKYDLEHHLERAIDFWEKHK